MTAAQWAELLAPLIAIAMTALYRLIDRFIPDETGKHPLPTTHRTVSDGPSSSSAHDTEETP